MLKYEFMYLYCHRGGKAPFNTSNPARDRAPAGGHADV